SVVLGSSPGTPAREIPRSAGVFLCPGNAGGTAVARPRFHDLEVWSGETEQGSVCIVVTTDRGEWMTAGWAPAPLDPTADINFYPGMRAIDGLELDDGSVVRFILRENAMEVWVAPTDVPA
ncbi:MAG TPA: hypothetical protein VFN24_04110, partial [Microbacterium sp.]|nr:hypothetical protein [Microbacterium sp.]